MSPLSPPEASRVAPPRRRLEIARYLLLAGLSALIWIAHAHKWTAADWHIPTRYGDDALEILSRIKIASEGGSVPFTSQQMERLGAPVDALWNAYPTPEKLILLLLGGVARLTDVFVAANVGMVLAQMLNALAFYWVVHRWLRVRWEWAMAGALLFACNYQMFHRGLAHYSFFLTWVVPLGLLACWLVARSSRLTWRSPGMWTCLGAGTLLGCHNTYYIYFWLPLMGWALLTQWFGPRRRPNLLVGVATIGACVLMFFLMNFEYWFFVQAGDAMPLLERNYGGTERYALKAVEMVIPPPFHNWEALAFLGKRYSRWLLWRGEMFHPYLGLVGITALIWLGAVAARRLLARRPPPGESLAIFWMLAFASIGGITNFLSFFAGLQVFRATNRMIIYIAAVLLVFLVVRLARLTARWQPRWRLLAALLLTTVGVLDQLPRPDTATKRHDRASLVTNDAEFGRLLESTLGPDAMVFQLPVIGFPEVTPPEGLSDYEHFRPYLCTDTLRFSYGTTKNRPRGRWQQDLPQNDPIKLVRELETYGFAGLYLNRKAFTDRGEALLTTLATAGYTQKLDDSKQQQVVVRLTPQKEPRLPLARTLTAGIGWHQQVRQGVRWAYTQETALLYQNPHPEPITVEMVLTVSGPDPLRLYQQGRLLSEHAAAPKKDSWTLRDVRLQPGVNTFTMISPTPAQRAPEGYLRTFGLHRSIVRRQETITAARGTSGQTAAPPSKAPASRPD